MPNSQVGFCGSGHVFFNFHRGDGDPAWTTERKDKVRTGFLDWHGVVDPGSGRIAHFSEVDSDPGNGVYVVVTWHTTDASNYGRAWCDKISFNSVWRNNLGVLGGTATHEMGHVLTLKHAHRLDSREAGTPIPSMATCIDDDNGQQATKITTEADDHAALVYSGATENSMHANEGFENGTRFWTHESLRTDWEVLTGPNPSAPRGSKVLRFRRHLGTGANWGVIYQSVRVITPGRFDGGLYARKGSSGVRGRLILQVPWRALLYGINPDCPTIVLRRRSDWMRGPRHFLDPTTSYQHFSTRDVHPQCDVHIACSGVPGTNRLGAEIRIRLRNVLRNPDNVSDHPWVYVDEVRGRQQ